MVNTLNTLENFKELAREAHLLVEKIYIKCDSMNDWEIPLVNYYGSVDKARFEWRRTAINFMWDTFKIRHSLSEIELDEVGRLEWEIVEKGEI